MNKKRNSKKTYNKILLIHSQWMKENGYDNWKECERESKDRLSLSFSNRGREATPKKTKKKQKTG